MDREQDLRRHLKDLVTRTFEGAADWPLQVLDADDVRRQQPIIAAIVEAEPSPFQPFGSKRTS